MTWGTLADRVLRILDISRLLTNFCSKSYARAASRNYHVQFTFLSTSRLKFFESSESSTVIVVKCCHIIIRSIALGSDSVSIFRRDSCWRWVKLDLLRFPRSLWRWLSNSGAQRGSESVETWRIDFANRFNRCQWYFNIFKYIIYR
jgi:hypothetical protein